MPMTPTVTYTLFGLGFFLRLITHIQSIAFTQDIYGFLSGFPMWLMIETQSLEVLIVTCFMVGFAKKLGYLRQTYPNVKT